MSDWRVVLTLEARADIRRLDAALRRRILDKLEWMAANAELMRHSPLQGEEWLDCFKYRVGDYRIFYQLDWPAQELTVLKVGHRRDVYE